MGSARLVHVTQRVCPSFHSSVRDLSRLVEMYFESMVFVATYLPTFLLHLVNTSFSRWNPRHRSSANDVAIPVDVVYTVMYLTVLYLGICLPTSRLDRPWADVARPNWALLGQTKSTCTSNCPQGSLYLLDKVRTKYCSTYRSSHTATSCTSVLFVPRQRNILSAKTPYVVTPR